MHNTYMSRCIQLAKNGLGTTSPNPLVGSVIVYDNKIIGEGWHYQAGEAHAEVHAINSVNDPSLLEKSTIYVSLEPCSHYGKTPPCSDLIIEKGIKKVVIGTIDPFARVSGAGIQKLMTAGCDVVVGILEKECQELNKRFFTFHTKKRPYIILKWAETSDGYVAPDIMAERKPVWITTPYSRQLVHKWRAEEDAIMVGSNTVIKDNPKLTIREWSGKNPIRVVLDRLKKIPQDSSILNNESQTIIINSIENNNKSPESNSISSETNTVDSICNILYNHGIQSVIIEGGTQLLQSFIDANLWDEAKVFVGTTAFGSGIKAPDLNKKAISIENILNDSLRFYKND